MVILIKFNDNNTAALEDVESLDEAEELITTIRKTGIIALPYSQNSHRAALYNIELLLTPYSLYYLPAAIKYIQLYE